MDKKEQRERQIVALRLAQPQLTLKQLAIASKCSMSTVRRALDANKPVIRETFEIMEEQLANAILERQTIEQGADNIVDLATNAANESVREGAQVEIWKRLGLRTRQDKARDHDNAANQRQGPMFILPPGANVAVTIHQSTPIGRDRESLHNIPSVTEHNDTTTSSNDE